MGKLLGFHGTDKTTAEKILLDKTFVPSHKDSDWLGKGVYFFENDLVQAYHFAKKARKYQTQGVVEAEIHYDILFDLTLTKVRFAFDEMATEFRKAYAKNRKEKLPQYIDGCILEALYKIEPYDAVRADYEVPGFQQANDIRLKPIHRQVCVKNLLCIKNIKGVPESEYR